MTTDSKLDRPSPPSALLWPAHLAVWALAAFAGRLSRVGSQIELHITGRNGAEIAPDHLRRILMAPTTEFKAISLAGIIGALILAVALRSRSPKWLRRVTLCICVVAAWFYVLGYVL